MSETEEFALTPTEEAFFRRFFQRLVLRYLALACIVAAAVLLGGFFLVATLVPTDSEVEEVAPVSPLPSEPEPLIDIRAELGRVAAELAATQSRGDEKAKDARRRAAQLTKRLEAALQRLAALEATIAAAPPPAAPAPQQASIPADLGGFRERLHNLERRQDRVESARTRDTRALLDRVGNLELFRQEIEEKRDSSQASVLDRLHAIEERISRLE